MKKLAAALFLSSGLVAAAPAAVAAPPVAACHGLHTAHERVPEANTTAHESIPHCPVR
jgi:hypothetical protein